MLFRYVFLGFLKKVEVAEGKGGQCSDSPAGARQHLCIMSELRAVKQVGGGSEWGRLGPAWWRGEGGGGAIMGRCHELYVTRWFMGWRVAAVNHVLHSIGAFHQQRRSISRPRRTENILFILINAIYFRYDRLVVSVGSRGRDGFFF